MTNEELIKKIETQIEFEGKSKSEYNVGRKDAYKNILILFKQLEVPEERVVSKKDKVEVPQFVADWIEEHKYSNDLIDLYSSIEYATDSDGFIEDKWQHSGEFYDWLSDDTDNIYLISDAMRYGYTIEPEPIKTRQVLVKFFDNEEYRTELTEEAARELIEFLEANKK